MNSRNRTPSEYIGYALYFYFSGLSLRKAADRLSSSALSKETIMFQSGIGFRNTDQRNYLQPKEKMRNLLLMKR
jgi:hypothetical protein